MWLALYERSAQLHDRYHPARQLLAPESMRALPMAVENLGRPDYLNRLAEIEKRMPQIRDALARDERSILRETDRIIAFRREALLANPLLDSDRLLLVKRGSDRLGLPQNHQGNCAVPSTGYDNEVAVLSPVSEDAVFGAEPVDLPEWGRLTGRSIDGGYRPYMHSYEWPETQVFRVEGFAKMPG